MKPFLVIPIIVDIADMSTLFWTDSKNHPKNGANYLPVITL